MGFKLIFRRIQLLFACILVLFSCKDDTKYEDITQNAFFLSTKKIPDSHFLGDQECKKCHQQEFKDWEGSHHDKAMQTADSLSVLGDFNNTTFSSQGVTSHFYKKGSDFFVNTEGPDGINQDYKIIYTFGVTPLQQYIVQFPNGHYQCLRTAWDVIENKWFDLYPDFKVVHSEWLHWSRGALNWNNMCADCHSTNVRKNYDEKTHSYNTTYAIINVNCEACHGAGKQHVEDVNKLGEHYKASGAMRMTMETAPKNLIDQCARCHMRREQFSASYNFEGTLLDHYFPQLIETPIYHADGQILDEDYVFGSFIQSKMYQNNVACNSCHNSHSLNLKFEGNMLCTQCHSSPQYDTPKHHFHANGTEGALCINCHMPGKYYMGNDFRRDHSFRVPRPDLSLKYGTPNACVGCHKDKTNEWAWESFKTLYGQVDSLHFSDKLTPGILGEPGADVGLSDLINDHHQPEMVRASAVKALSQYQTNNLIDKYLALLNDESPLVRGATLDVLGEINTTDYDSYFLPLLNDSKRTVRIKAFYALSGTTELQIPEKYRSSYQKVKTEFSTYLNTNSDFVGGQIKKANYYLKQGNLPMGIEGHEKALEIDGTDNRIRLNLANLYYRNQEFKKSEEAYKTVVFQEPEYGPVYYSLGLLYAELNRTEEAIEYMEQAMRVMPENIRVYYNLSLLFDKNKDVSKAEITLLDGLKKDGTNESLLYALSFHYYNNKEIEKAKKILKKLVQLYPANDEYKRFLQNLN
ncbi:tetratricopeptide repeat protein [Gelidibacter salicanalis]|uniref:Tetratricopeptide repeat protein n=1 Tax=Gelidibacter salicanalis TaxID=291193 RepID=A0A934KYP6_9FLAO|nr:tetratricopeptide repeat protein [Gelidibacter salicanalis]MBJ7882908.1 tetratricopeptide repeat protein [Gelidibacter salicanalis]